MLCLIVEDACDLLWITGDGKIAMSIGIDLTTTMLQFIRENPQGQSNNNELIV